MALPIDHLAMAYDRLAPLRGSSDDSDAEDDLNDNVWSNPGKFLEDTKFPKPWSHPNAAEMRIESREHTIKILEDWAQLHKILERHEATLRKRWLKKTREKRIAVLLSAWPNMAKEHRPDIKALMKETPQQRASGSRFKEAFMWPYINLEGLGTPKTFLLFLNTHGRNPPHTFAHADSEAAHFGYACGALLPAFLNNHVMMFTGRTTPETYGELIAWEDHEDAFSWLQRQKGSIQDTVYKSWRCKDASMASC